MVLTVIGGILSLGGSEVLGTLTSLVALIGSFAYYFVTMARSGANNGQTFGKQIMGIRVVRDDGQPVTAMTVLVREVLGKFVSSIIFYIGYLMAFFDSSNRALHDRIATTHVVRD
jgi:uncharacterized RDD family membrane protein YckC